MSEQSQIEAQRQGEEVRKRLRDAFKHFKEAPKVPQKALDEYTERTKLDTIDAGEYEDFAYQVSYDRKMARFIPDMMEALSGIRYVSEAEFTLKENKALVDQNDAVVMKIRNLLEDYDIPYNMIDNVESIGKNLAAIIARATGQIANRAGRAFQTMAEEQFGTPNYTVGMIGKFLDEKDGVKRESEVSTPEEEADKPSEEESASTTGEPEVAASVCSAHQKPDPNCSMCHPEAAAAAAAGAGKPEDEDEE